MNSDRVERRRPNRLGIASKSKEKRPTAISPEDDLTQPSRTTPRPPNAAQARIIEKEKVLTNMQEHLAHIQELEAERAAKHQEKRDKAKQKVVISVLCVARRSWPSLGRSEGRGAELARRGGSGRHDDVPSRRWRPRGRISAGNAIDATLHTILTD